MKDGGDCRTAPATPGLLTRISIIGHPGIEINTITVTGSKQDMNFV